MVSSKKITLLPLKLKRSGNHHTDSHSSLKTTTPPGATNAKRGLVQPLTFKHIGAKHLNILPLTAPSGNGLESQHPQSIQGGAA